MLGSDLAHKVDYPQGNQDRPIQARHLPSLASRTLSRQYSHSPNSPLSRNEIVTTTLSTRDQPPTLARSHSRPGPKTANYHRELHQNRLPRIISYGLLSWKYQFPSTEHHCQASALKASTRSPSMRDDLVALVLRIRPSLRRGLARRTL